MKITRAELVEKLVEDMKNGWDQETIRGWALEERRRQLTGLPNDELLELADEACLEEVFEIVPPTDKPGSKWSHQFVVAITVSSKEADPEKVPLEELVAALALRISQILGRTEDDLPGDGREAFQHTDTAES